MQEEVKNSGITWINIQNPDEKDVKFLRENFNICSSILQEYIPPIKRPKVEEYKDYLFVVIHFPVFIRKSRKTVSTELDAILFKNVLITSYTGTLPELEKMFRKCTLDESYRNYYIKNSAVHLLYRILDKLINARLSMLDYIDDHINHIETEIFNGNEGKMVSEIATVKRDIISFRRIIKPQRMVLESLSRMTSKIIEDETLWRMSAEVIGSNMKVWNNLENHKEMIEALEHTNESLLSYKLNDTMKILTAFSVVLLPLSLIANIFGMNVTDGMPFVDSPFGFWIVFILMVTTTLALMLFFEHKKWL